MMMMGGNEFKEWFGAAGKGAGLQTFFAYGNGPHIAPQVQAAGRENVFISTGIPCGCCGRDRPRVEPMDATLTMGYIDVTRLVFERHADNLANLEALCHGLETFGTCSIACARLK